MRRIATLIAALASCSVFPAFPATIAEWSFNSVLEDGDSSTGSLAPSRGEGTLTFIGGAKETLGSVGGGASSDSAADNSQVRVTGLPSAGQNNKGAGLEFTVSSAGYENLAISWDHYNSATASRYWRVQYTIDGFQWIDHESIVNTNASRWERRLVSLNSIAGVNDRGYLSFRIVPEFEYTALGAGAAGYVAVAEGSTYRTAGTWWLDMISITGRVIGASNSPPIIGAIEGFNLEEGAESEAILLEFSDAETPPDLLVVMAEVSNPEVISEVTLEGSGANRSLVVRAGIPGEATVTLRVSDEEMDQSETAFVVTVTPKEPVEPIPENFVIVWNFNSVPADFDPATGAFEASAGNGEIRIIGTESHSFGSVAQGKTSDPAAEDNSMLRVASFPRQGTANQSAGVEIRASTAGLRDIGLVWDQYNSATASRFWRVQFTTNSVDYIDYALITNAAPSRWTRQYVSFRDVPGAANNALFGLRFVSEFAPGGEYVAVKDGSGYSTAGTLWLDMMAITGEPGSDEKPLLSVALVSEGVRLSWPIAPDYQLEMKEAIMDEWRNVEAPMEGGESDSVVIVPAEGRGGYFRLRKILVP